MKSEKSSLPLLGYLGLSPQFSCLLVALQGGAMQWSALAVGYGYAAIIFSFLGGIWWGIGIARPDSPKWIFVVAVGPSLLALASYLPWIWGEPWPKPSLLFLGVCLLLSPIIDRAIIREVNSLPMLPENWLRLRYILSLGLGGMTLLLGLT